MRYAAITGNIFIRIVTAVLATVFLVYSLFMLWDMYRTDIAAFASYDLIQYRPNIEEDEPPYLDELLEINPDTAAWVTVYGTNIDYPIFQGETDMEYINKNAYGEYSISGSIFMSVLNKKDFTDPYNLIYGHHMDNGSMFGDIQKFKEKSFFDNTKNIRTTKEDGVLILQEKVYNLTIFGFLETDAYDDMVYLSDKTEIETQELIDYIKREGKYYKDVGEINQVIAMSTCDSRSTDGRNVLFCKMEKRTEPLPTREKEPLTEHRKAIGHPMAGAYWSLLNLFLLILTVYTAFPIHAFSIDRKKPKTAKNPPVLEYLAMTLICVISITLFVLTQDLHKPIQVVDIYTPIMLTTLIITYLIRVRIASGKWGIRIGDN